MPYKQFNLSNGVPVKIYKLKRGRSIRLSINTTGNVRISMPSWVAYHKAIQFAESRVAWISSQITSNQIILKDNIAVGKAHRLYFKTSMCAIRPQARIHQSDIIVSYPPNLRITDATVQLAASRACIRALRTQALQLLPIRLQQIAARHDINYQSIQIKQLKSRWGSCDYQQNIVLNLFLVQLPWDCIDYVILHELIHTRIMKHGPSFWIAMEQLMPEAQSFRNIMRRHQPTIRVSNTPTVA